MTTKAFVIVHKDNGIYLGNAMGLAFWSNLDSCGQSAAVTFPTEEEAEAHVATWANDPDIQDFTFEPVIPDDGDYASIAACVHAGLVGWLDADTTVANERMI